jgi:hypothetical protein
MDRATLLSSIEDGSLADANWYREMFTIPVDEVGDYIKFDSKTNIVTTNKNMVYKLNDIRETPLLLSDKIELNKGDLNVETDGIYTLGDIILNYLLIFRPMGAKMLFIKNLSFTHVENYISYELGKGVSDTEYIDFVDGASLLEQFSDIFVVSSTDKSISPAPGIRALRKRLYKEYREKYGEKVDTDIRYAVEIDSILTEYDREYIKDDPTYGIIINEKVLTNARKNLFGTIGTEIGMDGQMAQVVENSLIDGYPNDNKQMAALINSSRKGSIMRGYMTQYTGADANVTSRVLNTITVVPGDCGTKDTLDVLITKDNYDEYINYYIMESGKPLMLTPTNAMSYIGKTIKLRTYMDCKQGDMKYCSTCAGRQGEDNKKIAIILSTENNSIFTNSSMKAMHDKTLKLVDYDLKIALF